MNIGTQEQQAKRLMEARQARGFATARDAADRFGFNYSTYSQHERGVAGISRAAKHYAAAFGVSEGWLITGDKNMTPPGRIPMMGLAAGSVIGSWHFDQEPIDWLPLPPALKEARDVYALVVRGNSMYPEHKNGELRFVDPRAKPVAGDSVIIQQRIADGEDVQTFIKQLVRKTDLEVTVLQHDPAATIRYPASTIVAIHKVMTINELFGI